MIYTILVILLVMLAPDVALFMTMPAEWPVEMRALVFVPTAVSVLVFLLALSHKIGYPRSLRWFFFLLLVLALPKCVFAMVGIPLGVTWGLVAAGVVLLAVLAGYTWGWRHLVVREVEMSWPTLPPEFDGYRVTLFSDLHMGTIAYHPNFVKRVIGKVNDQRADLIVFGGDLVNRRTREARTFLDLLSTLSAPDGVLSVVGNHDQGDDSRVLPLERGMGWRVLLNEHVTITRGDAHIVVAGIDYTGVLPKYHISDKMVKALDGIDADDWVMLLSHDPSHWHCDVAGAHNNVALTLSGHTHAAQLRIGRFSPARLIYRHWGGLYACGDQKLYVTAGISGSLKFRLGAWPEIVNITLHRG